MIVTCIANTGAALPVANMDPRRGYDRSTEFSLTIGRTYPVFGLTVFLGTMWYYVLDDDGHRWPIWFPSALFDIVDGRLPSSWVVGYVRVSIDDQNPVVSFPEWANDESFYERLVDDDPEALRVFRERRREIDGGCV